jgi:hypothetical protein
MRMIEPIAIEELRRIRAASQQERAMDLDRQLETLDLIGRASARVMAPRTAGFASQLAARTVHTRR